MSDLKKQKIRCDDLWKIFGSKPERIVEKWHTDGAGISKTELLEQTGCVVGVRHASFSIYEGEVFVLMGLSGSGKSTLLRLINRLHNPTKGKVYIDDQEITGASQAQLREIRRKKTGMVFQSFALLPHRRVIDNVAFGLEIQNVDKKVRLEKSMESLKLVGLKGWEKSYTSELSGGMQQRVGLARALAPDPEILLLDEAFSALDPMIRRQMQDEFLKLISIVKKTIVFVTHDLHEALKLADRIAVMKFGEIVQLGTPEGIVLHPKTDYVAQFVKDLPKMKFITASSIMMDPEIWMVKPRDTVAQILQKMNEENLWYAFVIDKDGRMKGALSYKTLVSSSNKNKPVSPSQLITDFPRASHDTFLEELPSIAAKSKIPLAVLDNENRVKGFIPRKNLLDALSSQDEVNSQKEEDNV
jgi:glycine betaine/proline transport system ATP-binding protein